MQLAPETSGQVRVVVPAVIMVIVVPIISIMMMTSRPVAFPWVPVVMFITVVFVAIMFVRVAIVISGIAMVTEINAAAVNID